MPEFLTYQDSLEIVLNTLDADRQISTTSFTPKQMETMAELIRSLAQLDLTSLEEALADGPRPIELPLGQWLAAQV